MICALTKCLTCCPHTSRAFSSLVYYVRFGLPVLSSQAMLCGFHTSCTHPQLFQQSAVRTVLSQPLAAHTRQHLRLELRKVTTAASASAAGGQPIMQDAVQQQEHQPMNQHERCTHDQMLQMIQEYDCWVFDCDGTLWKGNELIEGVMEVLALLRQLGKQVLFMTNNSMKSRQAYLGKFVKLGVPAAVEEIYSSSYSAAAYLDSIGFDRSKKAYVVGERGIMDELSSVGITSFGGPDYNGKVASFDQETQQDPTVGAVVCGVDPGLSYYKIQYASLCLLNNPGCLFIATNADARGHFTANQEWAGAGATVGAIKAVVEREPTITGKPSPFLLSDIIARHNCVPQKMIMVGDRLDTDILWGRNTGMATLLVMTGVTDDEVLACSNIRPHFILDSFGDLRSVVPELQRQ